MKKLFAYPEIWFLTVAALVTRFWNLSFPNWVVFDEAHHGLFATKYLSHQYYFDLHPPLGKMILSFTGWLGGVTPGFDFAPRSLYLDSSYIAMRFAPALFGALLVPLVYVLVRQLGFSRRAGFIVGFLVLVENALIVESRFILLNIILVFFIFLALSLFLRVKRSVFDSRQWYMWSIATGFALAAASSVKWIGLGTVVIVWTLLIEEQKLFRQSKMHIAKQIVLLGVMPLLLYIAIFTGHMLLLSEDCLSNCGSMLEHEDYGGRSEEAFASFNFVPEGNLIERFISAHVRMVRSIGGGVVHEALAPAYQIPFKRNSIVYASEEREGRQVVVILQENFFSWIIGLIGIIGVLYLASRIYAKNKWHLVMSTEQSGGVRFLLLGYLVFFVLLAAISSMLMPYHYFTALIFSFIMFAIVFDRALSLVSIKKQKLLLALFIVVVTGGFLWGSPFTYGFLSPF